ncbi:hypothetical protein [Bradyrhizobium sp. CCBAU 11386]|uniref:hypothetical protein n=1 Tax=Bradyrhizobium sp. CCBAU 11386 TaxID=1630837 RepID=UPI00230248E6|nr:hypothetical protein [Bradyrhizobium sp. CCBAU 11386]
MADGGPDHPTSVGAICPTCHRLIHHGEGGSKLNIELEQHVLKIEQSQDLGEATRNDEVNDIAAQGSAPHVASACSKGPTYSRC